MKPAVNCILHPGFLLKGELKRLGIRTQDAADAIGIARTHLSQILNGHYSIASEMAVRLSICLGTSPQFWLNAQANYDISIINVKSLRVKPLKKKP